LEKSIVAEFAQFIQTERPDIKGFSASNVWRMSQFYETYSDNEKLASLVREINWTHNLIIMSRTKTDEAREFYLLLCSKNNYSKCDHEHQIDSMIFERTMISDRKNKLFIAKNAGLATLRDSYVLEFLDVPETHKEKELRKSIMANIRNFILEFGKDFTFVGEEYRIQVENTDFFIDLLFFSRSLSCLVAIELKVTDLKPEHLGKLEFYLEALDRDVRKPNENPSVGLILCSLKQYADSESTNVCKYTNTFYEWLSNNLDKFYNNRSDRLMNRTVAIKLLPLFEKHPVLWQTIHFLKDTPVTDDMTLCQYLFVWKEHMPKDLHFCFENIIELLNFK